jgi:hypothetical protein
MILMLRVLFGSNTESSLVDYISTKIAANLAIGPTVLSSEWELRKYFIDTISQLMGSDDCTKDKLSKDSSIDHNQEIISNFVFKAEYKEIIPTTSKMFKYYAGWEMAPGQANYWPKDKIHNRAYDFKIRDFDSEAYWTSIAGKSQGIQSDPTNTD